MSSSVKGSDPWLLLILAIGAVLLLTRLDNGRLWQDEAETAVLGKNILRFGYPKAYDGVNLLNPSLRLEEGYAWTYHSWLPLYLVAGSFLLFGVNTFAARLPCALFGIGVIWLAYRLAKRLTGDRWLARLSVLLLVASVPFLLHMRQCRYYAAAVFFTLWATMAYWRFLQHRRFGALELTLSLVLLFHADHGVFLPVLLAFGLHLALSRPSFEGGYRGLAVLMILLTLTVPWIIYLQALQHHRAIDFTEIRHHFEFYFRQTNRFLFPIVFWILTLLVRRPPIRALFGEPGSVIRGGWRLMGCLLMVGCAFLVFIPEQRHFRYLIFLVPFLFLLQATLLSQWFRSKPLVASLVMGLLIFTDLLHNPKLRFLPLEFVGELTHPYRGPIDGIVELLQAKSRVGEVVKTPYEEHPLIFYTDLKVEQIRDEADFERPTYPEWIVIRRDWVSGDFFKSPYYQEIKMRYRQILLDAPDIPWQNRPDPGYHRFRTDEKASPVIVFQKIK